MAVHKGKRPWNVVVGAFVSFTLLVGFTRCFGIFYTAIMELYDASSTEAALVVSVQNGVRTVAGI